MSDENPVSIDPRFDPAFQRGFEGAVTTTRRRPTIGTPPVLPAQEAIPRIAAPPVVEPVVSTPAAPVAEALEAAEVDEPVRGANPFIIGLWVIAVVLVGGGVYLMQWARTTFVSDSLSTNIDFVVVQAVTYGAPMVVVLGLATAIGLLFFYAIAWKKRR